MSEVSVSSELAERADEHNVASRVELRKTLGSAAVGAVCVAVGIVVGGVIWDAVGFAGGVGSYWQSSRHLNMCREERDQAQSLSELLALDKIGSLAVLAEQPVTEQILAN